MENTTEIFEIGLPESLDYLNPLPALGFIGDVSVKPLTAAVEIDAALIQVNQKLTEFVASPNFEADLQTAFGASTDVELGATIIEALSQGETPEMMVLSATSMNGADGAFDSVTGKVYLSDAIIHSEKLVDVITEEFGHYLDSQLNEIDSPGDEGELFMRLVNGEALTEADITGLRNQNDWGFIWVEGEPVAVQMSGSQPEYTSQPFTVNGEYIPVPGDFNGSGRTDILWYKPGPGADYIWYFNEDGSYNSEPFTVNGEYIPVTGDFNGSGRTDILWYAPGPAADYIWYFNSDGTYNSEPFTVNGEYIPVTGDFNGSGRTDILWYAPGPAADYIWYFNSDGTYNSEPFTVNGEYIAVTGDFNGSGRTDILWYAPGPDPDYIWSFNSDGTYESKPFTVNGVYTPITGDFNRSGRTDILWYAPGPDPDYIWSFNSDGTYESTPFTVNGVYEPISGDFNGSGYTDILWYAPGPAPDYLWYFGEASTPPVVPPPAPVSVEPGNTPGTAGDLGVFSGTQTFTEFVGTADPNDYYRFTLSEVHDFDLNLFGMSDDANVALYLAEEQPDGSLVRGQRIATSANWGTSDESITTPLGAGTYFVHVYPRYTDTNTRYTLTLEATPTGIVDEGIVVINNLEGQRTFRNFVGTADLNDYYSFTLSEVHDFELNLFGMSDDANVALYLAEEQPDGSFDWGERIATSANWGTSDESITTPLGAGTYFVHVYPRYTDTNTRYTLTLEATPTGIVDEGIVVINNLEGQRTFRNFVGTADLNDYYSFTLSEVHDFELNLFGMSDDANVALYLAEEQPDGSFDWGERIATSANWGTSDESITTPLGAGTYFVHVYPRYTDTNTRYTLTLEATPTGIVDEGIVVINNLEGQRTFRNFVGTADRNDYYRFTLSEVRDFELNLFGMSDDANVALYLAQEQPDGSFDWGQRIATSANWGTSDESITRTLGAGTYFVHVYPRYTNTNTKYTLQLTAEA